MRPDTPVYARRVKYWLTLVALGVGLASLGCDQGSKDAGCKKDTDCKGERVCADGACVSAEETSAKGDDDDAKSKKKKKKKKKNKGDDDDPKPEAKADPTNEPKAAPKEEPKPESDAEGSNTGGFTIIETAEALKRLGPKMKAGSKIVHKVFEGPFGPSPKSLFAVTQRKDASFWVYVMGDDNKPWPAGPGADPEITMGIKVPAVAFFDANGDGTTDALVMQVVSAHRGKPIFNENILLKWTDLGMRRLLNLEPKIKRLGSVAEVKKALGVSD